MKINYLPNLEPGSKIDLGPKKEKPIFSPEEMLSDLKSILKEKVNEYNRVSERNWLNDDASIKLFDHEDRANDLHLISAQEDQWAQEEGKDKGRWLKDRQINYANLTEMALTAMLQKILPSRFMVVRASAYDDYNHGVDQLILDKESGDVVCGIDEVIDRDYYSGPNKKEEKIKRQMAKGGFQVKYGAKFKNSKLFLQNLKNIPAFYLSLSKSELQVLFQALKSDDFESNDYKNLFLRLKNSLLAQQRQYDQLDLKPNLRQNLIKFGDFLNNY